MILAVSRFRVREGFEEATLHAFQHRPHVVEGWPGFLGMEVFTDGADCRCFSLVTRWTAEETFRAWHRSDSHNAAHALLPPGLKLDGAFTKLTILERLPAATRPDHFTDVMTDAGPLLRDAVCESNAIIFVSVARDGRIEECNPYFAKLLGKPVSTLLGCSVWTFLTDPDAEALRETIESEGQAVRLNQRLNFVSSDYVPSTFNCLISRRPTGFVIVGEPVWQDMYKAQRQLIELHDQTSVLMRDVSKQLKELKAAKTQVETMLHELRDSYWHLRKLGEVLPICLNCGKIKSVDMAWERVTEFLKKNALPLSHGYCPECAPSALSQW